MNSNAPTPSGEPTRTVPLRVMSGAPGGTAAAAPSVIAGRGKVRASKNAKRRAAVLILVHILIAIHVGLWMVTGMRTVTPVEPSEAMYTLEQGMVNAGFVFFALALLSTAIFGRFFCGWACHVVALQDLCSWMMKKLGVHPKPFRSRLLVWVPLGLALYMFVWPTFRREVLQALAGDRWAQFAPWLGVTPPRPELQAHFLTTDFWATFPPWFIAIPFLLVCGFGVVYFMGSKGFCTYCCPYGGFFGPIDRIAPGRILVSDACSGCGHCTAVCTSNIRVHEEVRDYGAVVSSGCMKCMDCVSVCPNEALRFGFARPPALGGAKRRATAPKRAASKRYDLTWPEELGAAALFLLLLIAYRGMFNSIPLLMAAGLAAIGTYLVWKLLRLWRDPNVRIQSLQLKLKGRLRPAGAAFGAIALLVLVTGAWASVVKYHLTAASILDDRITAPMHVVFAPQYVPDPADRNLAGRAASHLGQAAAWRDGGIGWALSVDRQTRLAWLLAVAGESGAAEDALRKAIHGGIRAGAEPAPEQMGALVTLIARRGGTPDDFRQELLAILELNPDLAALRLELARLERDMGRIEEAAAQARLAAEASPEEPAVLKAAADVLLDGGRVREAVSLLERAATLQEGLPDAHAQRALVAVLTNDLERALAELALAYELEPNNPAHARMAARIFQTLGREAEATEWMQRANRAGLESSPPPPPPP